MKNGTFVRILKGCTWVTTEQCKTVPDISAFMNSFTNNSLSTYHVQGTVFGSEYEEVMKIDMIPVLFLYDGQWILTVDYQKTSRMHWDLK